MMSLLAVEYPQGAGENLYFLDVRKAFDYI